MPDFAQARRAMVDGQIRVNDVTDPRLVQAFLDVPRELFVPAGQKGRAYLDADVALPGGRALMKPMVLAKLLQAAQVPADGMVLDVGPATGYTTALLSHIAGAVVAVEEDPALAAAIPANLATLGDVAADVVTGNLKAGAPGQGPFDVILIAGAVDEVPPALFQQLRDGGRLATVVGEGRSGRATIYTQIGGRVSGRTVFEAAAVPMPGFARAPSFSF